ncbi:hypothetical protein ACZ90_67170 [Streptomyces albus subsp. albus]|nr:hypothetical protein ACZ90_67170 [Streptomyces albus subsp. albus]
MTRSAAEADWLYYRLHATTMRQLDAMVDQVVRPAVDRLCREEPAGTWFFLRYLDGSGLHLRLRLNASERALAAVEAFLGGLLADLFARRLDTPVLGLRDGSPELGRRGVTQHVYEPEFDKWGGPEGVALAEAVFRESSELVLSAFAQREPGWSRLACATAVTARSIQLLGEPSRAGFLHHYAWYWYGRVPLRDSTTAATARAAARRSGGRLLAAATAVDTSFADPYLRALSRALSAHGNLAERRLPAHLLFHHIHLTNNRLGVTSREEAVIAEALRFGLIGTHSALRTGGS